MKRAHQRAVELRPVATAIAALDKQRLDPVQSGLGRDRRWIPTRAAADQPDPHPATVERVRRRRARRRQTPTRQDHETGDDRHHNAPHNRAHDRRRPDGRRAANELLQSWPAGPRARFSTRPPRGPRRPWTESAPGRAPSRGEMRPRLLPARAPTGIARPRHGRLGRACEEHHRLERAQQASASPQKWYCSTREDRRHYRRGVLRDDRIRCMRGQRSPNVATYKRLRHRPSRWPSAAARRAKRPCANHDWHGVIRQRPEARGRLLTCPGGGCQVVVGGHRWGSLGRLAVRGRVEGRGCVRGRPGLLRHSTRVGSGSGT